MSKREACRVCGIYVVSGYMSRHIWSTACMDMKKRNERDEAS